MRLAAWGVVLLALPARAGEGWVTHAVALLPDLTTVVRGRMHAERGTSLLRIEGAASGAIRVEARAPSGPVRAFAFRGDGKRFVASGNDGKVRLRETSSGRILREFGGHRGWVHAVAYARDGRRVASAGYDRTLRLHEAETGRALWRKTKTPVAALAFAPDGKRLATTDNRGHAILWDVASGARLRSYDLGHNGWSFALAVSGDGRRLAAGTRRIRVIEIADGRTLATLDLEKRRRAWALALSHDGTQLAIAEDGGTVRLRSGKGFERERNWKLERTAGALVFSKNGGSLGAACFYGRGRRLDLR